MKKIVLTAIVFASVFTASIGTAYSQNSDADNSFAIAYLIANELSDDFNIVTYDSDYSSVTFQMHGDYLTEYSAKTVVMSRLVKKYSDIEVVFPWTYVQGFLSTMLHIEGYKQNIVLLLKETDHACELFIVVKNGSERQQ